MKHWAKYHKEGMAMNNHDKEPSPWIIAGEIIVIAMLCWIVYGLLIMVML